MLQAVVALLSTGPVGPSDKIGHSNVTIIKAYACLNIKYLHTNIHRVRQNVLQQIWLQKEFKGMK